MAGHTTRDPACRRRIGRSSRSSDLRRLRDEGYSISIVSGHLVVWSIPFVVAPDRVAHGKLIVRLDMVGDATAKPTRHDVFWAGGAPCDDCGRPLTNLITSPLRHELGGGLVADHHLCNKPVDREFVDYHELVTAYVALICGHAATLDPTATARGRRRIVEAENPQVPFEYVDTASPRAGIGAFSAKFEGGSVAIVGLGGTGRTSWTSSRRPRSIGSICSMTTPSSSTMHFARRGRRR